MSHKVFANSRELSGGSGSGKAACAFPDVCFTPGSGVPVPYPNTGVDADTWNGSRSVRIARREVMLKDKSYFKMSTGDEAGCAPKKGVLTSRIKGKVYFNTWSMDVKIEGENVVRHLDLTTHNHGSKPGNTPTWPYLSTMQRGDSRTCGEERERQESACAGVDDPCACVGRSKPSGKKDSPAANDLADQVAANQCLAAQRCTLQQYLPSRCCPPQTPHHLVEAAAFLEGRGKKTEVALAGVHNYQANKAPCVCAEGVNQNTGTHGLMHTFQSAVAARCPPGTLTFANGSTVTTKVTTYADARDSSIAAFQKVFPHSRCGKECLQAQLDSYHRRCGINDNTYIKAVKTGSADVSAADEAVIARNDRVRQMRATRSGAND